MAKRELFLEPADQLSRSDALRNAIARLDNATQRLADHVCAQTPPVAIYVPAESERTRLGKFLPLPEKAGREKCIDIILALRCLPGKDIRYMPSLTGAVALSDDGLCLAGDVNACKRCVQSAWKRLDDVYAGPPGYCSADQVLLRKQLLEEWGWPDLHHRQAVREFLVFDRDPGSIEFFWKDQRTFISIDPEKIHEMLHAQLNRSEGSRRAAILKDVQRMKELPDNQSLVLAQMRYFDPGADIRAPDTHKLKQRAAAMPYMLPGPELRGISARWNMKKTDARATGSSSDQQPLLYTLPVYRREP